MNNDLISRSALKKTLIENEWINGIDSGGLENIIDNAPTVEERPQGEWIPIKTRPLTEEEKEEYPDYSFMYDCQLPDDGEEVLVTTSCGYVVLDTFYRDDGCYFENYCDEGDIIAWQSKPKPYKREADNDK